MDIDRAIKELVRGPAFLPGERNVPHKCTHCGDNSLQRVARSTKRVTAFRTCRRCGSIQRVKAEPIKEES